MHRETKPSAPTALVEDISSSRHQRSDWPVILPLRIARVQKGRPPKLLRRGEQQPLAARELVLGLRAKGLEETAPGPANLSQCRGARFDRIVIGKDARKGNKGLDCSM